MDIWNGRVLITLMGVLFAALYAAQTLSNETKQEPMTAAADPAHPTSLSSAQDQVKPIELKGFCDASAAVALDRGSILVASDEDNVIRTFRPDVSSDPISSLDISSFLEVTAKDPEADIEAATGSGDTIYWITSHGTSKNGKSRPNRRRFFASAVKDAEKGIVESVGKPYSNLLDDLTSSTDLKNLALDNAATRAPKDEGSLNIEGLAATPDGRLLIAFRNPIPSGKALIVPLNNPKEVINEGRRAQLGRPIFVDLGGLGVRDIEYSISNREYLLVAGPYGESGGFALYRWTGRSEDVPSIIPNVQFGDLQPEAIVIDTEASNIEILSDDGIRLLDGIECKQAPENLQRFRVLKIPQSSP